MDLILCHTTADFDALGAAVGLSRLLPGSRIVLAGGAHPAVRDFLALHRDEYALIERRSVNPKRIRALYIVDVQARSRLGKTAEWLDLPQVERIVLYDHHPTGGPTDPSDIPASERIIESIGATTTLIVEQLQAQNVALNASEATVMALGIHVDTGSLRFEHSTARDAAALAWLMAQGANVRAIAEYSDPGFSPALQDLLGTALGQLQSETVHGYRLAWVLLTTAGYVPGLSSLTAQLLDLTESDALLLGVQYAIAPEETRLSIIGRCRIPNTSLTPLFQAHGGGGHPQAATVTLRHSAPQSLLTQLVTALATQIPAPLTAHELMSSPVRTIRPETSIAEAQRLLLRYGHSGLSVVNDQDQLVGILSRRDLELALHHGFGHAPVKGYMTLNPRTIAPTTPLPEIERLMVTYDIGRLPVLEKGDENGKKNDDLVGIVTRTDVLRALWGTDQERRKAEGGTERGARGAGDRGSLLATSTSASLRPTAYSLLPTDLLADFPSSLKALLQAAAEEAERWGWQLYLVGGGVRDLLLASASDRPRPHSDRSIPTSDFLTDIDLVVDGFHRSGVAAAGVALAERLRDRYPAARLEVHGKFQTAALLWHQDPVFGSLWVDIATARTEFYPYPAANPEVEASSIQQDLYRRDFTINALALRLTQPRAGELLDFFGGVWDLQRRSVRVLHANSFIEDPTRIYRAVRFAVRLGFEIEPQTEAYIRYALESGVYERTQGENNVTPALQTRLRAELNAILAAPYWRRALRLLGGLDALKCLHSSLQLTPQLWHRVRWVDRLSRSMKLRATEAPLVLWLLRLEAMIAELQPSDRPKVAQKLQLPADSIGRLSQLATLEVAVSAQLQQAEKPSQIYQVLQAIDLPLLLLLGARSTVAQRRQIWQYLMQLSVLKSPVTGQDLKAMGYQPGKQFKVILEAVMVAYLDGELGPLSAPQEALRVAAQNLIQKMH